MSRYHSYLNTAVAIVRLYRGQQPLAVFLRSFFATNRKYGSNDRKQISHLCYCYYRTGRMFFSNHAKVNDRLPEYIPAALFLCSTQPGEWLHHLRPSWQEKIYLSVNEKCKIIEEELKAPPLSPLHIFPWKSALSEGTDYTAFCDSFLIWPDLFIRVRPGHMKIVQKKLGDAKIGYRAMGKNCLALDNTTKLHTVIETDREAVIQDYSSQQIAQFLEPLKNEPRLRVWDCCAASGGKSILVRDILPNVELTVTDIRKSILLNLKKRFATAGIEPYSVTTVDLTLPLQQKQGERYDLIICDVPCSGSGTWSRTPEQLYFWPEEKLDHYVGLQKKITQNVIPFLKPGGYLLYITCSVFKAENEDQVIELEKNCGLKLIRKKLLKGYDKKADTMFAALLKSPAEDH
ncbi:MAG: methyltransferase domain-containing protein [Chitinophagaceae bacterium]|nr:methyltransferase domain-containing protein [Chitinophagaceae bacterium]